MPSFIAKIFGGGKKKPSAPAVRKVAQSVNPQTNATAEAKQSARDLGRGKTRNQTVKTSKLGISPSEKSGIVTKTLTGA